MLHRLGDLASALGSSNPAQRHCYASPGSIRRLLATPGVVEDLLTELTGAKLEPGTSSKPELLGRLERTAIRLSLAPSRFHGLSLEEIVVLSAYSSAHFDRTSWKQEVSRQPNRESLEAACYHWLWQRVAVISSGAAWRAPHWPLAGSTGVDRPVCSPLVLAVAPLSDASTIDRDLGALASEAGFANEHYVACTPATAIEYLQRAARVDGFARWDPFALDRQLQALGLGLLLIERGQVLLYLPARYHSAVSVSSLK